MEFDESLFCDDEGVNCTLVVCKYCQVIRKTCDLSGLIVP
mgnify:CR=1 FL=1